MGMEGRGGNLEAVVTGTADAEVGSGALLAAVIACGLSPFDLQGQSSI